MDKNETRRQTALREVEEETGLPCSILSKVSTTRHTYRLENGKRVLKTTKWYKMNALHNQLKLQYSEYIEDAKWMIPTTFLDSGLPTYASIKDAVAGVISG
jgi:8-oxo-dGTP pyrophosphatase MutT (NUDIX family)